MLRLRTVSWSAGLALASVVFLSSPAAAVILTGPGGRGVPVGSSSLIPTLDYSDTFTQTAQGGAPGRPDTAAVQPLIPAYIVENSHGNASQIFSIGSGFSFASDTAGLVNGSPPYPGGSGAGSATGITQTGGGVDYAIPYGLRDVYTVQVDAVQSGDRIDISSGGAPGIFAPNSLSIFFRGDGSGNASLFNGTLDTNIQSQLPGFNTGIPGGNGQWHNYAVTFNRPAKTVELFVDEVSVGLIDLTTFAGGLYQNYSNAFVGAGAGLAGGQNRTWTDNFQVGGSGPVDFPLTDHPNPGLINPVPAGLISFWDFNEASGPQPGKTLNFAYDRAGGGNHGRFLAPTTRLGGLIGNGSALFNDTNGEGVVVGPGVGNNFSTPNGITIEVLFSTNYDGSDQAEFFRKEDGGNRILLSFQSDANTNNAFGQLIGSDAGFAGISLGLNTGGYKEMDVALDGLGGRPTLAALTDGSVHHLVATYDAATGVKAMYIDGVLVGMVDGPDNVPIVSGGTASAYIGSTNGVEPFPGILDEVAIWNRALSPAEIQFHYQNTLNGQNYFVPEPGTWVLAVMGLAGCGLIARRRRRQQGA